MGLTKEAKMVLEDLEQAEEILKALLWRGPHPTGGIVAIAKMLQLERHHQEVKKTSKEGSDSESEA